MATLIQRAHSCLLQVRNEFYKDTQGAMLVYDVTNRATFDALDQWVDEMKLEVGSGHGMDNIVFVLCANKVGCHQIKLN